MWSFIKDIVTGGTDKLVGSLGVAIDSIITSDEERLLLKNALAQEINRHKEIMLAQKNEFDIQYEAEFTKRHANDMKSDSWLSKNVRPLVLCFMTVSTVILAYATIFILTPSEIVLVTPWKDLLQILLLVVFSWYFGGRSLEKITTMKNNNTRK